VSGLSPPAGKQPLTLTLRILHNRGPVHLLWLVSLLAIVLTGAPAPALASTAPASHDHAVATSKTSPVATTPDRPTPPYLAGDPRARAARRKPGEHAHEGPGRAQRSEHARSRRPATPAGGAAPAELQQHLSQGPPSRGTKEAPITWLFEPESFSPMAKLVGDEQYSIVTDHLGTPVLMTDAGGKAVWSANIGVYGDLGDLDGERQACPFRWPGQYEDAETGLYYNRFRYYDAESGEYVSQDPTILFGGLNPYQYVGDPTRGCDPLGLWERISPKDAARSDAGLRERLQTLMYRDKRSAGGQGTHGLVHRVREQIHGKMRPGSAGWKTHEQAILRQQRSLRSALSEWSRRSGIPS
jgi:RHS repeat-associated protein